MSRNTLDDRGTIKPKTALIELRGESGRLYGMLDPQSLIIHIKRNEKIDRIDLKALLSR